MKLKSIKKIKSNSKRYDIQTPSSNFFANSILIHNSTLIVSQYLGELIIRTRGTISAQALETGDEIELLKEKYPKAFDNGLLETNYSVIYEWVTPHNRIVIKYPEPDIYLIAVINHENYSMLRQSELDYFAPHWKVKRPRTYTFNTLEDMHEAVEAFKGVEGICCYCNHGQDIRKLKGAQYLKLHHLKSELASFEKLLDVYINQNRPDYITFFKYIEDNFDFEIANAMIGEISQCCDLNKKVESAIDGMKSFLDKLENDDTVRVRKDYATRIFQAYGQTNKTGFVFTLLDGNELKKKDIKKLFYHQIKKK